MRRLLMMIIIAFLAGVDQLFKYLAAARLMPVDEIALIPGVLRLRYVENTGAAFSSFKGQTAFLAIFTAVVLVAGLIALAAGKIKPRFLEYCAVAVIAGGIGNFIDRAFRGFVIDYIDPLFVNFAVFNFADCLVTVGAFAFAGYVIYDIFRSRRSGKAEKQ